MASENETIIKTIRYVAPNMPGIRISQILNISRERVRVILNRLGEPTRIITNDIYQQCKNCANKITGNSGFCSEACKETWYYIKMPCANKECKNQVILRRSYHKSRTNKKHQTVFCCSRHCHITYLWHEKPDLMRRKGDAIIAEKI